MRLQHKLVLPLVAVFAAVLGYFHLVWMPALQGDAEAEFHATTAAHLDSVAAGLVPLLLADQLDVLHETMDALLAGNADWRAIVVTDSAGRLLYPHLGDRIPPAAPGQALVRIERPVAVDGARLGTLAVIIDRAPSLERQQRRLGQMEAAFIGFALLMLIGTVLVTEGAVLEPLRQLARASRALAGHDFDAPLPAARRDEIGRLIAAFAAMREARRDGEAELARRGREAEAAQRERELILDAPQEGICGIGSDGLISFINPAARRMLGWDADEGVGLNLHSASHYRRADGSDYPPDQCPVAHTLADGMPRDVTGEVYWRKDGSWFPAEYSVTAIRDGEAILGAVVVFRDITQRQAIERALRQKTEALERSNVELEQFAYVASHDLREPLRIISSYVSLLERRYGPQLDDDARDFIAFARNGAQRLNQLILDLLEYSCTGRIAREKVPVAVRALVDEALAPLLEQVRDGGAVVRVDPSVDAAPDVPGRRDELVGLLRNLLDNALKYRHPDRVAEVRVAARVDGGMLVLSVADNGIGIEQEYFDRIFRIFQRLHVRERYPGTGIGLPICKRIAEQHGGTIRLESVPGEGSTFHVGLPLVEAEPGEPDPAAALLPA